VALFTGNYNYIKDGVALTLNRLVAFLESRGVPVLVFAPVAESPAFASAGELVPVPSFAIPGRPEYRIARGLPETARQRLGVPANTVSHRGAGHTGLSGTEARRALGGARGCLLSHPL
jgi:hypothetical protein